jgi:hypothetical protein
MTEPDDRRAVVITLIPGEEYLVLQDPADEDVPDDPAVQELRMRAYELRGKETLDGPTALEVIGTVAGYMASGVVGNATWAMFPAAARWVQRVRSRRAVKPLTSEDVVGRVRGVAAGVLGHVPRSCVVRSILPLEDGWSVVADADGQLIHATFVASRSLVGASVVD